MSVEAPFLETIVRSMAAGLYLASALLIVRPRPGAARAFGALAYTSKSAHVLAQFPPLIAVAGLWGPALTLVSMMGASLTWVFGMELMSSRPRLDLRRLFAPLAALVVGGPAVFLPHAQATPLWLLHTFISVALMTHLMVACWSAWRAGVIDRRRLAATPLFVISALYSIGVGYVQTLESLGQASRQPSLFAACVLLFSSALAVVIFGNAGPALFGERLEGAAPRPADSGPVVLSSAETRLASDLERLMREERLYRLQNLSISSLAVRLRTPEHRLRQLLNQSLGYRNFNAYIARWRLSEAREALSDPAQAEVPISTIAIDSGFQSLAPFNRAFKAETGMTPTEFRLKALGGPDRQEAAAA